MVRWRSTHLQRVRRRYKHFAFLICTPFPENPIIFLYIVTEKCKLFDWPRKLVSERSVDFTETVWKFTRNVYLAQYIPIQYVHYLVNVFSSRMAIITILLCFPFNVMKNLHHSFYIFFTRSHVSFYESRNTS